MAWTRTAVSLIGFGFTIVQFFERLADMKGVAPAARPEAARYVGLMLIGAGILALLVSTLQYRKLVHYLWSPQFKAIAGPGEGGEMRPIITQTPMLATAIALTVIGAFAFGTVWLRLA